MELAGAPPGSDLYLTWVGRLFYIPAFAGGIFGLLGGYLTDRLGRRRVLTWSILLYAFSAFAAGLSTSVEMLLFFRSTTFIGVCVEFVAAVAWLAELFPHPERRERVLGYTQGFSSFGGLLIAVVNSLVIKYAADLPAISIPSFLADWIGSIAPGNEHQAWRYTLMSGLLPALPLVVIRPFLPESPAWVAKKQAGTLKRPSVRELFSPDLARTTIVTTVMFACSYGAAFGAIQMIPQIVPGLADVKEAGSSHTVPQQRQHEQKVAAEYTKLQEIGGLVGRFLLAALAVRIVSRRNLLRVFQFPGLIVVPLLFYFFLKVENQTYMVLNLNAVYLGEIPVTTMSLGLFVAGLVTVAQFSFWGNYLPRVYPIHLRGTGESFAANVGGRMIGTSFAWVTATLAGFTVVAGDGTERYVMPGSSAPERFATTAAAVALFVYAIGNLACFFLPEPKTSELPE
jgi:MFS family permease